MFKIGDYAVCPGHGVAQLCNIEDREVGAEKTPFYIFKLVSNGMTVMVPTASEDGIRGLVGEGEISDVYNLLNNHDVDVDNSTWNRRYREYMIKVKTGSLTEIAEVLRSLFLLKTRKNLSFGEKKMLDSCRELLVQEISLSKGEDKLEVKKKINSYFN
ncbi:MAG: CarD family transcriptional regulator [Bacteriovoracaceae bacterium]|nr:CarD family transcriptional regulator [Bacteriovoracaceae bacterium]